jgi:hypothetical protein
VVLIARDGAGWIGERSFGSDGMEIGRNALIFPAS